MLAPFGGRLKGRNGPVGHDAPLALASTASGASRAEPIGAASFLLPDGNPKVTPHRRREDQGRS
jgi:hypothetical protein